MRFSLPSAKYSAGLPSSVTNTAEYRFVVWTVHNDLITARSAVVGSWEAAEKLIDGSEKRICRLSFEF